MSYFSDQDLHCFSETVGTWGTALVTHLAYGLCNGVAQFMIRRKQ